MKNKFLKNITLHLNTRILLTVIILFGAVLRLSNLNWDSKYSFQPDERMIALVASEIKWESSVYNFLSPESSWNPNFFAYGSFPIYLLKIANKAYLNVTGELADFDRMINIGRVFSALFDTGVIVLIYFLVKTIAPRKHKFNNWALYSAFSYALFVLPIQLSHYYAVDTILNFFILLTVFFAIKSVKQRKNIYLILTYVTFSFATATKITALVLIPLIVFVSLYLIFKRSLSKQYSIIIFSILIYFVILFLLMPYLFIDWREFFQQIKNQSRLFNDPFALPYTLQYVGTLKYLYFVKNIALWGTGIWFFVCAISALLILIFSVISNKISLKKYFLALLVCIFYAIFFIYFGYSSVKFMRYMLPIYPLLAIFCGLFFFWLTNTKNIYFRWIVSTAILILSLSYPLAYANTYSQVSTRIQASNWINDNANSGSKIAIEHWDDRVPVNNVKNFQFLELTLYDQPDNNIKWERLNKLLDEADYIIIASNRLYKPIKNLSSCKDNKVCYPMASKYYEKLFNEKLGFKKVAEFTNIPRIPILNIIIDDSGADESFNVYDRPRVMIFKKIDSRYEQLVKNLYHQ